MLHRGKMARGSVTGERYNLNTNIAETLDARLNKAGSFIAHHAIDQEESTGNFPTDVHGNCSYYKSVFGQGY